MQGVMDYVLVFIKITFGLSEFQRLWIKFYCILIFTFKICEISREKWLTFSCLSIVTFGIASVPGEGGLMNTASCEVNPESCEDTLDSRTMPGGSDWRENNDHTPIRRPEHLFCYSGEFYPINNDNKKSFLFLPLYIHLYFGGLKFSFFSIALKMLLFRISLY